MMSGSHDGLRELQAVTFGDLEPRLERGWPSHHELGELTEEAFEPARADDLDHVRGCLAGVPHRVHLAAGLCDVATGTEHDLAVPGAEADLAPR